MAKFIMYKLFIVRRRGFDKNDRKIIIFPKTVKKLNLIISDTYSTSDTVSVVPKIENECMMTLLHTKCDSLK